MVVAGESGVQLVATAQGALTPPLTLVAHSNRRLEHSNRRLEPSNHRLEHSNHRLEHANHRLEHSPPPTTVWNIPTTVWNVPTAVWNVPTTVWNVPARGHSCPQQRCHRLPAWIGDIARRSEVAADKNVRAPTAWKVAGFTRKTRVWTQKPKKRKTKTMAETFIPTKEELLSNFLGTFVTNATGHEVAMGLTVLKVGEVTTAKEDWDGALAEYKAKAEALKGLLAAKDAAWDAAVALMREINNTVQSKAGVNPDLKANCGLPVYDDTPTRVAVPASRPVLGVDASQRLQHKISFRDADATDSRAKPEGVREIELWSKVGAPAPTDASQCQFVLAGSKNGLMVAYTGAQAGQPVHYMARWKNTRGEYGPWSETVIATIGA